MTTNPFPARNEIRHLHGVFFIFVILAQRGEVSPSLQPCLVRGIAGNIPDPIFIPAKAGIFSLYPRPSRLPLPSLAGARRPATPRPNVIPGLHKCDALRLGYAKTSFCASLASVASDRGSPFLKHIRHPEWRRPRRIQTCFLEISLLRGAFRTFAHSLRSSALFAKRPLSAKKHERDSGE